LYKNQGLSPMVKIQRRHRVSHKFAPSSGLKWELMGETMTTTDLKLAPFPTRSPLPLAALPSVSLLPAAPLTDGTFELRHSVIRSAFGILQLSPGDRFCGRSNQPRSTSWIATGMAPQGNNQKKNNQNEKTINHISIGSGMPCPSTGLGARAKSPSCCGNLD
jgi:hypothetical protein